MSSKEAASNCYNKVPYDVYWTKNVTTIKKILKDRSRAAAMSDANQHQAHQSQPQEKQEYHQYQYQVERETISIHSSESAVSQQQKKHYPRTQQPQQQIQLQQQPQQQIQQPQQQQIQLQQHQQQQLQQLQHQQLQQLQQHQQLQHHQQQQHHLQYKQHLGSVSAEMQQQPVDGQTIQVQQVQISHDGSDQIHTQPTQVASSNATMIPTSTMVMAAPQQTMLSQQAMQNLQSPPIAPMPSQGGSTTITTMSTNPAQQMADWPGHGRVQVIQQPLQNPTYIQPVYNAQGQLIVPGNIALHPASMNQPIQVIAAGKAFQPGQMPHMLTTTQGKPLVQGQATSFPGYATIPTSGSNQTLVLSPLGVLGQTNLLPQQQGKPQDMQKMIAKTNVNSTAMKPTQSPQQNVSIGNLVSSQPQGITTQAQTIIQPQLIGPIQYTCNTQQQRAVPQGTAQAMQFAPWQATFGTAGFPQGLAWAPGAIQSSALLAQGGQILIRNPQHEQPGMFIHNAQPSTIPQHTQMASQQIAKPTAGIEMTATQPAAKAGIPKAFSTILPNSITPQNIRPASSVSTQTGQTQTSSHQTAYPPFKAGTKLRTKNVCRMPSMATSQKSDASNQTKTGSTVQFLQPKLVVSHVQPGPATGLAVPGSPQDKVIKQVQQQGTSQQQMPAQQQPLSQIEQMQTTMFQQPIEQKNQTGQMMVSNGLQNTSERGVTMPVVSMAHGQMANVVGNMIVQTVPGIQPMGSSLTLPAGQPVQSVPVAQEIMQTTSNVPIASPVKQTESEQKETTSHANDAAAETGPGRPEAEENNYGEDSAAGNLVEEPKPENNNPPAEGDAQVKSKSDDEKKEGVDKDAALMGQPKAMVMVKPQVLTHVIEGFVIQESSEPFPVNRGCMDGLVRKMAVSEVLENGEPPKKKSLVDNNSKEKEFAVCETCGKKDLKSKFKKSKRFCTLSCAKRGDDKMNGGDVDSGGEGNSCSPEGEPEVVEAGEGLNNQDPKVNPTQWTVAEVCEFIRTLPGCADYVDDFAMQDIDGEALMLLKPDHLMSVMSMKLGPAVKIIAKIDTMRGDGQPKADGPPGQEMPKEDSVAPE